MQLFFINILFLVLFLGSCSPENKYKNLSDDELCKTWHQALFDMTTDNIDLSIMDEIRRRCKLKKDSIVGKVEYYSYTKKLPCARSKDMYAENGIEKIVLSKEYIENQQKHKFIKNTLNYNVVYDYEKDASGRLYKDQVRAIIHCSEERLFCISIKNDTVKIGEKFLGKIMIHQNTVDSFKVEIFDDTKEVIKTISDTNKVIKESSIEKYYFYYEEKTLPGIYKFSGKLTIKPKNKKEREHWFKYKYVVVDS